VSQPLEPVTIGTLDSDSPMSRLQRSRVRFYLALIKVTRLVGGIVLVAELPSATATDATTATATATPDIGAILLWLPPSKRIGALAIPTLWRSGLLSLMLPWHYGLTGVHRIELVFEGNIAKMWARTLPDLPPRGFQERDCGFVQMIARNPKYARKGYASELLRYQIGRHFAEFPDRPVLLDTTTLQGIRAYERLGFKLLAEMPVETGTDAAGIKLARDASEEVKKEARQVCVQRVMARLPEGDS
jgi:GNAT superfamily N-acetyltransferase